MSSSFIEHLEAGLRDIESRGLMKRERALLSAQSGRIAVERAGERADGIINLCANNYLGLADDDTLAMAARDALDNYGYGMASVRFICGTQALHRTLEEALAAFLGKDDAILFAACFDANGGLFEPLLTAEDAIVSDALNHASIIDGIRLCKARRYRYANADMQALEDALKQAREAGSRFIMIATDGVFSMDGYLARLPEITALARRYDAMVMVDDCHATGFMGEAGAGTPSHCGVADEVDILTGTLGKALGGAMGGYVAGPRAVVDMLRQRARPYLFSNALPPMIVAASLAALERVQSSDGERLRRQLFDNTAYWRDGLQQRGFTLLPGEHPIVPVMLGEAPLAQSMASLLFDEGIYVSGFFYPVVPEGQARIRTQMNATLTCTDLDQALAAFEQAGRACGALA